ncbi:MAG: HlyD family efflux transporter periplasmic adaptor subunit [Myxococcales bacterium]|nr:HlyD family efflux transporter periplasmic adaptor subunit [Myxococcales bacterium]
MSEETRNTSTRSEQAEVRRQQAERKRKLAKLIKRLILVVVVGIGVAGIVISFLPKPIIVDIADVSKGPMRVTINEDGKTEAKSRYVLSAPLSGNMNRIRLQAGDLVTEGENILRIVPGTSPLLDKRSRVNAEARLAAAKAGMQLAGAEVARATAGLEQVRREAARIAALLETGVASESDIEQANFAVKARIEELRAAHFSAKVRKQDEASARAALGLLDGKGNSDDGLDISAPVSGKVLRVLREDQQGLVVAGSPLVEIADLSALEITADILTADAVHIKTGAKTRIVRWGGETDLVGHVRRVEPSAFTRISALGVEEQRVLVIVDIDSPKQEWEALGDGYRVEVEISVWEGEDVLTAPASSAFRHEGKWAVYAIEGGIAKLTPVEIGHRNDLRVEILGGLAEGAQVVAHPSDRVVDGAGVTAGE